MKYANKNGKIYAYEDNQDELYNQAISSGSVALTEQEAILTTNPPPTEEQEREAKAGARRTAYQAESDPLFFQWQYDNTPESEKTWRDKVREIKERIPLD